MAKYLDEQGLRTLWGKIKERDAAAQKAGTDAAKAAQDTATAANTHANEALGRVSNCETKITSLETNKANASTTYTKTQVDSAITNAKNAVKDELLGGAGTAFDTLQELATALGNDSNFSTTVSKQIGAVGIRIDGHKADKTNPHGVTKTQVGLGNVDNTSDANKPISTAQQTEFTRIDTRVTNLSVEVADKLSKTQKLRGLEGADEYTIDFDSSFRISTVHLIDPDKPLGIRNTLTIPCEFGDLIYNKHVVLNDSMALTADELNTILV